MITSLGIFRELTDEFLENVAHADVINGDRVQIEFRERLHHGQKTIVLVHLVDLLIKVQAADDVLDICREALDVCLKVSGQVVGVIDQFCQVKLAGVVELEAGQTVHCLCRIVRICLEHLYDLCLGGSQGALKAADNNHRNDNILVLVALVCTAQLICDRP